MKSRVIQFAIVIAALTSVMGAFALISALDYTNPLGVQGTVQIYESSETTQHNSTVSILEKLASKDNVNLVKYVDDVRSPGSKRSWYIATGNTVIESGTWITRGYPDFTRDMTTTVRPLHDLQARKRMVCILFLEIKERRSVSLLQYENKDTKSLVKPITHWDICIGRFPNLLALAV